MGLRLNKRQARRLSMTSLIDVIFLLLLFFMLSSTFSRFGAVELMAAGQGSSDSATSRPVFLRLAANHLSLNGETVALEGLADRLLLLTADLAEADAQGTQVLVSLTAEVSSQRLVDVLAVLRRQPGLAVAVLG
ncbi:biopolymer transporter ExbD [Epibacterium sp. MM17-32]|uniref:ExbD/TolR family protein n=1 Tax=Epibacterium sp. MM17-32 TaxID=2917734 RepID=UPI0021030A97|nr:biopolymer transporter ExbD [Epibacterium sp. MM17-32]